MNQEFHYYATYCAAILAGYSHQESEAIGYSACMVDFCTGTLLSKLNAPLNAATTQTQIELVDAWTDMIGLQDITRIWSSFHFLPVDLYGAAVSLVYTGYHPHKGRFTGSVASDHSEDAFVRNRHTDVRYRKKIIKEFGCALYLYHLVSSP